MMVNTPPGSQTPRRYRMHNPARVRLPQDLVDYIIDHLHPSYASLRACALVCKAWTHCAQSHLLRVLLIRDGLELAALAQLFKDRPHLALHVRTLRLKAYQHWMAPSNLELLTWIRAVPKVLASTGTLLRVRALHFEHVQWDVFRIDHAFLADLASFARVHELAFRSCNFASFHDFEQLVLAVPYLRRLSLDAVLWRNDREGLVAKPVGRAAPKPHLNELQIGRFCQTKVIFDWLLDSPSWSALHTVEVEDVTTDKELGHVGRLLKSLGGHLQHLKIGCKFDSCPRLQFGDFIDLSHNTELRSLHLLIPDMRDDMMRWVPCLLSQIAAPRLERLLFDVWIFSAPQLRNTPWNEISWTLAHPRYSSVKEISFIHRGYLDMEKAVHALRGRLDAIYPRGVLSIEDGRPMSMDILAWAH